MVSLLEGSRREKELPASGVVLAIEYYGYQRSGTIRTPVARSSKIGTSHLWITFVSQSNIVTQS
jgi:hypothetical protein